MASATTSTAMGDLIPTLCRVGVLGNHTDRELLERFLRSSHEPSEASFAALLERHGPMVLRVCRQNLANPEDVRDAFQATFLVLAARARSIRNRDSLGPWLYGIAIRVCRRARAEAARRDRHERSFGLERPSETDEASGLDAPIPELHEELARLPEKYRSVVVLHYLEGLTTEAAARRLGCPQGTVLSRLSRARDRLRRGLERRGVLAPAGLLAPASGLEATALPADLARATLDHAMAWLVQARVDAPAVLRLTRYALWTTAVSRPAAVLTSLAVAAALAVGARTLLEDEQAQAARAARTVRAVASQALPGEAPRRPVLRDSKSVPGNLAWSTVGPEKWSEILERLAGEIRANHENIRTWEGTYRISFAQYLNANTAGMMGAPPIQGRIEPLIQEFESTVRFAADLPGGRYFQDKATQAMRFRRVGRDEPVKLRNQAPADGRMFTDGVTLVDFNPNERATTAFLPDHPDTHEKRIVRHWTPEESRGRTSPLDADPRQFLGTTEDALWRTPQLYAEALRGRRGEEQLRQAATRLTLRQAEGPGGTWYWMQTRLNGPGGSKDLHHTIIFSAEAGHLPVLTQMAWGTPDGKLSSMSEWHWQRTEGVYLPAKFRRAAYQGEAETLSFRQAAELVECTLNQPTDPHQFDVQGLGIEDGDVIVDHVRRTVSVWRDGEEVKLGDFVR